MSPSPFGVYSFTTYVSVSVMDHGMRCLQNWNQDCNCISIGSLDSTILNCNCISIVFSSQTDPKTHC